jgi:soluble cytochrome b562
LNKSFTFSALAMSIVLLTSTAAFADCEADLGLLETAMAAPNLSADLSAAMAKAGEVGAAAMRKDDDDTCHTAVMDVLAKAGVKTNAAAAPASTQSLGDLSVFKTIVDDTLKLVTAGKLPEAKTRIKDLETGWDDAHKKLQALNNDKWTVIDAAIDKVLKQLRSGTPTVAASTDALNALVKTISDSP